MDTFERRLLAFIRESLLPQSAVEIDEETYLFEDGLVDSLKILRVIAFVEQETGRAVDDRDIVMANFRSVRAIARRFAPTLDETRPRG
jgi:acyl carrier protein